MRKRFLGIFLAVALVVTCMPTLAFATEEVTEEETATQVEQVEETTEPEVQGEVATPEEETVVEKKTDNEKPVAAELVYTGEYQCLIAKGETGFKKGDAKYFRFEGGNHWYQTLATIAAKDAGEYVVEYKYSKDGKVHKLNVEIKKAGLHVVWENTELTYNGEKQKPEAYAECDLDQDGDIDYKDYRVKLFVRGTQTNAGVYAKRPVDERAYVDVEQSKKDGKYDYDNFEFIDEDELTTKFEIKKKEVTVTVQDVEKLFGYDDPEFTFEATGFVDAENEEFQTRIHKNGVIVIEGVAGEDVGTYELTARFTKGDGHGKKILKENYKYTFVPGTLTINNLSVVQGAEQKYVKGTKEGATFKLDGNYDQLADVSIDGVVVDEANYTVKEGSTIINFKQAYLDKLSTGKHEVTALYQVKDEETEEVIAETTVATNFTVVASPNTADTNDMLPFVILMIISIIGIAGVSLKRN